MCVHVLYYPAVSSERDHDFAIVSPSRFLVFFVFLPPKNEMKKDHVAELVDGSEIKVDTQQEETKPRRMATFI